MTKFPTSIYIFLSALPLWIGCANFSGKPEQFGYSKYECKAPIWVEASATYYPESGSSNEITAKIQRPIIVDATTDTQISNESDLDQYIVRILKKSSELTGCKFSLMPASISSEKIVLHYISNASHRRRGFWTYLSAFTLTLIPNILHNKDVLIGNIESGSNRKEFNYVEDSSLYIGLIFLPALFFSDPWSQSVDNFALRLSNEYCEISKKCKIQTN